MDTATPRKCAIHFSSTRQSASSAGCPRFRLTARSWRSSRSQYDGRVGGVERVEIDRAHRRAVLLQQLAEAAEAAGRREELDRGLVGGHHRAVVGHGDLLRAEQHLGGARLDRVGGRAQNVPKQDLRQLMHEQRRDVDAVAEQRDVGGLERGRAR